MNVSQPLCSGGGSLKSDQSVSTFLNDLVAIFNFARPLKIIVLAFIFLHI